MTRDEISLNAALEIVAEMKRPHVGGDCQLTAAVQVIVNTALDRLRKEPVSLPAAEDARDGWRPIETAPKDGTIVLLSDGWRTVSAGCYCDDGDEYPWKFFDDDKRNGFLNGWCDDSTGPKYWQPLPTAPAMSQDSKGEGK